MAQDDELFWISGEEYLAVAIFHHGKRLDAESRRCLAEEWRTPSVWPETPSEMREGELWRAVELEPDEVAFLKERRRAVRKGKA